MEQTAPSTSLLTSNSSLTTAVQVQHFTIISIMFEISLSLSESTKDYRALSSILEFEACDTRQCEDVIINDDLILELEEFFRVILSRTDSLDPRITLNPVNGVVHIIDNDCEKHSLCILWFTKSLSLTQLLWWV